MNDLYYHRVPVPFWDRHPGSGPREVGVAGSASPASSGLLFCHDFVSLFLQILWCFAASSDVGIGLLGVWVEPSAVIR